MGADRAQAMAALDGAAPPVLGRFSTRYGTPIAVNLLSGSDRHHRHVPRLRPVERRRQQVLRGRARPGDLDHDDLLPGDLPGAHEARRLAHAHVPRPYRLPGGAAGPWVAGVLCTLWAIFASIVLIYPGLGTNWFGQHGNPDSALPSGFTRIQFELSQVIPLAVFIVAGVLFYVAGTSTRQHAVQVPISEEMGVAEVTANGQREPRGEGGAASAAEPGSS